MPIPETHDLVWMLYDLDYSDPIEIKPQFCHAQMVNSMLDLRDAELGHRRISG